MKDMEQPIRNIPLENGLTLQLMDLSRRVAGDRWNVRVKAAIGISVEDVLSKMKQTHRKEEIESVLGKEVVFEKEMIRNFIDERERQAVVDQLCRSFLENAMTYLSRQHFAERFLFKQYRETLERKRIENLLKKGASRGDPSE